MNRITGTFIVPVLYAALLGIPAVRERWELALVFFAAVFLVPEGLALLKVKLHGAYRTLVLPLLFFALVAHTPTRFQFSDLLALPYLIAAGWITISQLRALLREPNRTPGDWLRVFAPGYWLTGAFWLVFDLLGIQPLDFDPLVVRLTAAHFHLAGFVLTVAIYQLIQLEDNRMHRILAMAAMIGMPVVAAGITITRLGGPGAIEMAAGVFFAATAIVVALEHLRLSYTFDFPAGAKIAWRLCGAFLVAGALLAMAYALRFVFPLALLNIQNMKLWHGTLNTLGFGWFLFRGWQQEI